MAQVPPPNYDYDVEQLVKAYRKAIEEILYRLNSIDLNNFERAMQLATLKSVSEILTNLSDEAGAWAKVNIEKAATDGVINAIVSLGVVDTVQEAAKIVKFNTVNKEFVRAAVADTQTDLLAVTQNVDRKVRTAVRQVSAEVMRANLTQGINGTQTLKRDVIVGLRKQLGDSVNTGIIDAAGKRWKPDTYVDMLVRTKLMQAHREATTNEALSRDAYYAVISRHGAKDECRLWEGKIVKLTPGAEGDYTYIGDLPSRQIFHNRCKHLISPIRRPDRV